MKTPIMGFFAPKCTIKGLIGFLWKPINPLIDAIKGLNGLFDVMGFGR